MWRPTLCFYDAVVPKSGTPCHKNGKASHFCGKASHFQDDLLVLAAPLPVKALLVGVEHNGALGAVSDEHFLN